MQGVDDDPAQRRDGGGIRTQRPVTDDRVGPRLRQVEHRPAIDGDAQVRQVAGDGAGVRGQVRRCLMRIVQIGRREHRCRRPVRPMGRPEALHPPTFLVDKHRRRVVADGGAQVAHQGADLIRGVDVAREQDEAERIGVLEKTLFRIR